jgi:uncharacterized Zn finger protein (UPF0148 family)
MATKLVINELYLGYRIKTDTWELFHFLSVMNDTVTGPAGVRYEGKVVANRAGRCFHPDSVQDLPKVLRAGEHVRNLQGIVFTAVTARMEAADDGFAYEGEWGWRSPSNKMCQEVLSVGSNHIDWNEFARARGYQNGLEGQTGKQGSAMEQEKEQEFRVGELVEVVSWTINGGNRYVVGQMGILRDHGKRDKPDGDVLTSRHILGFDGNSCGFRGRARKVEPYSWLVSYRISTGMFECARFNGSAPPQDPQYRGPHGTISLGGNYFAAHMAFAMPERLPAGVMTRYGKLARPAVLDRDYSTPIYRCLAMEGTVETVKEIEPHDIHWDNAIRTNLIEYPIGKAVIDSMDVWRKNPARQTETSSTKPEDNQQDWRAGLDQKLAGGDASVTSCLVCGVRMATRSDGEETCSAVCHSKVRSDVRKKAEEAQQGIHEVAIQQARDVYGSQRNREEGVGARGDNFLRWASEQTGAASGLSSEGLLINKDKPEPARPPHHWDPDDVEYELYCS